jgi:hypothetical protein
LTHRLDKQVLGDLGHGESFGAGVEAPGVLIRPEQRHRAIFQAIGLEPFEDFLRVMQYRCRRIERDRTTRTEHGVVPADTLVPVDHHHVIGEDLAEPRRCNSRLAHVDRGRGRVGQRRDRGQRVFGESRHGYESLQT